MCGSASRSGSAPCSRSAALVAGPIEASRGPRERAVAGRGGEEADGRGGGEEHVVGGGGGRARVVVERLGDGLVERERRRPRRRARAARRAARRGPPRARAISARRTGTSAQRLDEPLGDRALRHDVRLDPALAQGARRAGPDRGDRDPGERARVAQAVEQQLGAVRARSRRRGRSRRGRGSGASSGSIRIAGASTTCAPSSRSRAASALACARARVTATVRPCSGRDSSQASCSCSARDRADERDRRRADRPPRRRARRRRRAWPASVRWPGSVPRSIDRDRLVGRPPARDQPLGDARQRAHAHVEDERAGEARRARASRARTPAWPGPRGR